MNRCLIPATTLLVVAGLVLSWRFDASMGEASGRPGSANTSFAPALSPAHSGSTDHGLSFKSKFRSVQRKPVREDTAALARETILPRVELPEQSLAERVRELNRMIRDAGIDAARLTMVMDRKGAGPDRRLPDFRCAELRVTNVPLYVALEHIMDSTILNYQVTAGRVEFFLHDSVHDIRWRDDAVNAHADRAMETPSGEDQFGEVGRE